MQRIDSPHQQHQPHFTPIPFEELQELVTTLETREPDLAEFSGRLIPYPQITKRLLQQANSVASGGRQDISNPVHAAAYLGSRRLIHILTNLPKEMVREKTATAQ